MLTRPRTWSCRSALDEIVAEGARRMLAAALEAEVDAYVSSLIHEVDDHGPPPGGAQRARRATVARHRGRTASRSGPPGSTTAGSTR